MAKITTVGDRVKLKKDNLVGVVRFVGEIEGKNGVFFGVELDEPKGKNNGTVGKVKYFKCGKDKGIFVKQVGIAKTNSKNNTAPRITVGDKVKCTKQKCNGTVRFIGTPYSVKDKGTFYGIQLEKPNGKNNGTVNKRWFFKCKAKHGCFVAAGGLSVLSLGADSNSSASKKKDSKKKTTKKKKVEEPKEEEKTDVEYKVGDKVMIKPNRKGQIKWIGEAKEFGAGVYYGIRLTEKRGDCDGEWKEIRFFQCPEGFGVYVPLRLLEKPIDEDFDFMNEEEKYEEEARLKAEEYKKEKDKLQRLREKFNEVDTDGNQTIDRDEFKKLASEIFGCSALEANALFKEIDVNDSGEMSFAEFDAWVDKMGGIEKLDEMTGDAEDAKEAEEAPEADAEPEAEAEAAKDDNEEEPKAEEEAAKDEDAEEADEAEKEKEEDGDKDEDENAQADADDNKEEPQDDKGDDADAGDGDAADADKEENNEDGDAEADADKADDAAEEKPAEDEPAADKGDAEVAEDAGAD